jgi:hypothetical protein
VKHQILRIAALLFLAGPALGGPSPPGQCVVSILNRTAEVHPDGSWKVSNIPANTGLVRARFTCVNDGVTRTGQSGFFRILPNQTTGFEPTITLDNAQAVPASLSLKAPSAILHSEGATAQLTATAKLEDGTEKDVTPASSGTTYTTTNPRTATVSADGLVTAVKSGRVLISAMNESRLAAVAIQVSFAGDTDGDGIPDDVEVALGLDPNNPADAGEDFDQDGLTALQEVNLGTNPFQADTDGDGVTDGEEVAAGTDPLDPQSVDYTGLIQSLSVLPPAVTLRINQILPAEVTRQLKVTGTLKNGRSVDLTSKLLGTTYTSSDLLVVNFGSTDGLLFAGQGGNATVTVKNGGLSATVPVTVAVFSPIGLSFLPIPGQANGVDVAGPVAYLAAGAAGLQVVDVSDPAAPHIIGSLDTPGNGNGVKARGDFAYLADGPSGLAVINVSDPKAPVLAGSVDTPGTATRVVLSGATAFVADGDQGLQAIDISNPAQPKIIAALDTPGFAHGLAVDDARKLAVVADGPSGIQVVDISDPKGKGLLLLGSLDTRPGDDGGLAVAIAGSFAYVANGTPSANGLTGGLLAVDLSDPTHPAAAGNSPNTLSNLWDVVIADGLALAADTFSQNAVHSFNLSAPSTPTPSLPLNFFATTHRLDNGTGIAAQAGLVYLTGSLCMQIHGATCDGGLYIGKFRELTDDLGAPPTITITSPADGSQVFEGSVVTVQAAATDDVQVAQVRFFRDGELLATDTQPPFSADVYVPLGATSVRIGAQAVDLGDNFSSLATVDLQVKFNPPPTAKITSPPDGSTVTEGDTVHVVVEAADDSGVAEVNIGSTTGFFQTLDAAPFEASFQVPVGITELTINALVRDLLGKFTPAAPVTLHVAPEPPPAAKITSPLDGATVSGGSTILLAADASDDVQVARVRFSTSTGFAQSSASLPFQVQFPVPRSVTQVTINATAFDNLGKPGAAAPVTINVTPGPTTTAAGLVEDGAGAPVAGAEVTAAGNRTGTTGLDGSFSISGVPVLPGGVVVEASFTPEGQGLLSGRSVPTAAVANGTTDVGAIRLQSIDLLILTSDVPPVSRMEATGLFGKVESAFFFLDTPTLDLLSRYNAVLCYTAADGPPPDPALLGDVLADYVDAGGTLAIATYGFSGPASVAGRIMTPGYSPLVDQGSTGDVSGELVAVAPDDPVFAGVDPGAIVYRHDAGFAHPKLDAGAALLATDGQGVSLVARNAAWNVIALNLHPASFLSQNNENFYQFLARSIVSLGGGKLAPPSRTAGGLIKSDQWLALGPFLHPFGCSGDDGDLLRNPVAPSLLPCLFPQEGDPIDYDPALAATTDYLGPLKDGKPVWRPLKDSTPDGDLDLRQDAFQASRNFSFTFQAENVVTFLVTYVEWKGQSAAGAEICVGSDDGVQVWLDDRLVHNHNTCRGNSFTSGRGPCEDLAPVTVEPGVHRILLGVWNAASQFGGSLGIRVGGVPVNDPSGDWTFLGPVPVNLSPPACKPPVTRMVTAARDSSSCPAGGQGPVAVTLTRPLANGESSSQVVTVRDTALGPFTSGAVSAAGGGVASDVVLQPFSSQGFITAWLFLGPYIGGDPALPPQFMRADFLTDGNGITETNVAPQAGDTVHTDFRGAAFLSRGLYRVTESINPGGVPTWRAHLDPDDTIDFHDDYGLFTNTFSGAVLYAVTYVSLASPTILNLGLASESSVQVLLDGVEVHLNSVERQVGEPNTVEDVVALGTVSAGSHRLMVKVFGDDLASKFRLRFQDPVTKAPITQGFTVCLSPGQNPCQLDSLGAQVEWNLTRGALASGIGYQIALNGGEVRFQDEALGLPIIGDSRIILAAPFTDYGPFSSPDFPHGHAIGAQCAGAAASSPQPGTLVIAGAGEDIGPRGDQLLFAYQEVSGSFTARVKIASVTYAPGSRLGVVGIMARQDCSPRSRYSLLSEHGEADFDPASFRYRPSHGGADDVDSSGPLAAFSSTHFQTLRLDRCGNTFIGYVLDENGIVNGNPGEWVEIDRNDWPQGAPAKVLLGLAVNSHQLCDLTTATFTDWQVHPACGSP